jgi:hypothetical protein
MIFTPRIWYFDIIFLIARLSSKDRRSKWESVPVEKRHEAIVKKDAGIGDRINCCFPGTIVTYGRCIPGSSLCRVMLRIGGIS